MTFSAVLRVLCASEVNLIYFLAFLAAFLCNLLTSVFFFAMLLTSFW
jgi:hypothetical protein